MTFREEQTRKQLTGLPLRVLLKKYESSLHFYRKRSINDILTGSSCRSDSIGLMDMRMFADDTQFLRRIYHFRTLSGRSQIDQRLKACAQYYSTNRAYNTPNMIVTQGRSIFVNRHRRMRKIQAGEGSSDDTQQRNQDYVDFNEGETVYVLEEMEEVSSGSQEEGSLESFGDVHNVWAQQEQEQEEIKQNQKLGQKEKQGQGVQHLISDFGDKQNTNTQNQQKPIVINQPKDSQDVTSTQAAKKSDLLVTFLQQPEPQPKIFPFIDYLNTKGRVNFTNLCMSLNNATIEQHTVSMSANKQKNDQDSLLVLRSSNRRKKIRQKAQELLRRVKGAIGSQNQGL